MYSESLLYFTKSIPNHTLFGKIPSTISDRNSFFRILTFWRSVQGSDPKGKKPLENPPENSPENQLEISYTGKSPKIGSLDMS